MRICSQPQTADTHHTGAGEKCGDGLVEQEVVIDELILLGLGHRRQRVVLALQLAVQFGQG